MARLKSTFLVTLVFVLGFGVLLPIHTNADLKIGDRIVREEPPGHFSMKAFLRSNELMSRSYQPVLQNKTGTLVGVGTFRVFNEAAFGNFDYIFLMDLESDVVEFNKILLEAIRKSESAEEFRAHFIQSDYRFLITCLGPDQKWNSDWYNAVTEIGQTMGKNYYGSFFYESEESFQKIRKLVEENRVFSVHGSLTGEITLKSISDFANSMKKPVSTLSVSNAEDYFLLNELPTRNYIRNLKELAKNPDFLVTSTLNARPSYSSRLVTPKNLAQDLDSWVYAAYSGSEYIKVLDITHSRSVIASVREAFGEWREVTLPPGPAGEPRPAMGVIYVEKISKPEICKMNLKAK